MVTLPTSSGSGHGSIAEHKIIGLVTCLVNPLVIGHNRYLLGCQFWEAPVPSLHPSYLSNTVIWLFFDVKKSLLLAETTNN